MAKVNIGLRGWRFDAETVFDDEGQVRPIGSMPPDTRDRILRLAERVTDPCDACWLVHGEEAVENCEPAAAIYGEPRGDVVVCTDHERDFVYWFREVADEDLIGTLSLADAFHEWFLDGGRAPEEYPGLEHVDENPEDLPDPEEAMPELSEEIDRLEAEDLDALDVDLDDLDL